MRMGDLRSRGKLGTCRCEIDICLFQMYIAYVVRVRFVCVHDCNGCAGQCGEEHGGRMRMTEVCGGRARSPEASILAGLSSV